MSESAEYALQVSIVKKLTGDAGLMDIISGVFDFVTESADFPFLTIGDPVATAFDTKDSNGQETVITVHTWSQYRGKKEAGQIMSLIYGILHKTNLSLEGHQPIVILCEFSTIMKDPDGVTHHGVQRFRVLTEAN